MSVVLSAVLAGGDLVHTQAQAEKPTKTVIVAFLPLSTQDSRTKIYSKPVADEVAGHLRYRLAKQGRFRIESVSSSGTVPPRVHFIVDGRIVTRSARRISLEAHIRDPDSGRRLAVVATSTRALTRIDELASDLADKLAPDVIRAAGELRGRAGAPIIMPETVIDGVIDSNGADDTGTALPVDPPEADGDGRPPLVVFDAIGRAAGGTVPVDAVATDAGYVLASSLGFRPVANRKRGIVRSAMARDVLRQTGARYGLMIDVLAIDFSWDGVLLARGTIRVVVVDLGGKVIYDRVARTDTLVGNRGDRHAALVRAVMVQARDIVIPQLTALFADKRPSVPASNVERSSCRAGGGALLVGTKK
ncbi:MAG: hypothetical protein MJE77_18310 [Proteobacteria bacterium]|nr:hypothetical protein [Pseudomonadota bacterium]